ncbi:MAG: dockerin type I domain-containing protein, partial [Clostridia bacterium]|nr:dockerin type I domain-containing protein [Clostridia bacterium]
TAENVSVSFSNAQRYLGTGTKVTVTSDIDGTVIGEYYIVIYGDVTGDGQIDGKDTIAVSTNLNKLTGAAGKAANISGDRNITKADAILISKVVNKEVQIDQVRGRVK